MFLKLVLIIFYITKLGDCLDSDKPKLQDLTIPKKLEEGEPVKLHCDLVKGKQPVLFKWQFNNKIIENDENYSIVNKEEETTLKIRNLSINHLGNYKCSVSNSYGEDERKEKLYYNGKLPN